MRSTSVVLGTAALLAGLSLSGCGGTGSDGTGAAAPSDRADPNAAVTASPGATGVGPYAVTGTVTDESGRPVGGVLVSARSLTGQGVPELAVLTDAHGHYRWPSLQPGRYELLVRTYTGQATGQITVSPPGPASLDLTLTRS